MSFMRRDRDPYRTPAVSTPAPQSPAAPQPAPNADTPASSSGGPAPSSAQTEIPARQAGRSAVIPPANREAAAVIDKKSKIKGTLHTEGNVLIEGCFQGEIDAKETVWVENGSQTEAQLRANDVIISGSFNGEVDCRHRLQVTASATVSGEIKTPVLVIEDGATVNCRFSMARSGGKAK